MFNLFVQDGYYVQFDSDEATVLCSRYDVVVPHFKQHMLKKMTFEEEVHLLQSEMEMKWRHMHLKKLEDWKHTSQHELFLWARK